ncbi:uncharacterized protein Z520_06901 [Fonsecaea multimorphosa CBS 102226]|uniref:ZW10 C-terminal helical domain-containing protein n=1 Tax=Fonsecaea multimorphosa CBS 102226 TaxID=1442371 RepID=A0A0D2K2Z5_9EURO|nr:uncharacterized protein Z520_06901 [Fonsecaea multimorphosa CBS 102226]KIX97449.1 hypothetical protein Z520_06901 [Fonsecaea multimorphosa CBS 102226]OAL23415.1 hypothetical protein AYO22_06465 [Fonsecaea multimorphosa]
MSNESDAAISLCDAIVHGSVPQSEQLLTSDLSSSTISALLAQISQTRREISDEIREKSRDEAGSVDQWISRAKKVQEDIARCKLESKRIVEEHQQLQALRDQATDYQRKVELLDTEIDFTETLRQELEDVSLKTKALREVEECLAKDDPCGAASKLQELDKSPASKFRSRTTNIVRDLKDELRLKTRLQLETKLNAQILIRREPRRANLEILPNEPGSNTFNFDAILQALTDLGDAQGSVEPLTDRLRTVLVQPLRRTARSKLSTYQVEQHSLNIELSTTLPSIDLVLDFVLDIINFLQTSLPKMIQGAAVTAILPDLMSVLVSDWLVPELPIDLAMLDGLDKLQQRVTVILDKLKSLQWTGQAQLQDWMDDIQRTWLNKRKAATLDAVRKAFASAKGHLRQVERVEKQVMSTATEEPKAGDNESNDWDTSWDEDIKDKSSTGEAPTEGDGTEDEDTSGWGFDEEENSAEKEDKQNGHAASHDEDDAGEAWGWDDENQEKRSEQAVKDAPTETNGARGPRETEHEVTLTEVYSISEIPDHLVEIIGRDFSDAQAIEETKHKNLEPATASKGLLALPTLALAMFRATAPSYYGASSSLTDIHRYNDSLYIAERLRDMTIPAGMPHIDADIKAMEKFAKMAYSKEMETQRIIVWDLLEGAQGFTLCTQFPYSQEIENAVSSVVDRIRTLHTDWKPILSTSALMQSIGSLVTMVITKVISSIEEMDDISEPESRRLTAFCQQIASLEDLFLSTPPAGDPEQPQDPIPMVAVYVSNWLRFQYLINILESSLVDIKYLWTEGELSLEFSADEVVDLIKALFAESPHRRSAIAAIRGSRLSR